MGNWVRFFLLGLIWGSSFLLIRISVEEMDQYQIVFMRTLVAAIGLNIVLWLRGKRLPTDWRSLRALILIGLGNTAIPFTLITWGEKSVESGLASVLQATASLFTLVIAHFAFHDERINVQKIIGIVVGFAGVTLLASRSWGTGEVITGDLLGQLAIVVASLFYAIFTVFSRKAGNSLEPLVISAGAMTTAAIASGILTFAAPYFGGPAPVSLTSLSGNVLVATFLLGFVNTFLAYLMFYSLVRTLGAGRTAMVTYVVPPVGLILGVIFLNELLDVRLLVGAALIFLGIAIVNVRYRRARTPVLDISETAA
jgi:drug/metabolite transporter (DMT)-like permease